MIKKLFFACIWLAGIGVATSYAEVVVGNISLTNYWVRPSTGPNTAAYVTIVNTGSEMDKLQKAECPDASIVELHNHIEEDGIMKMRPVNFIEVAASPVEMKPGGLHIMLMELKDSFQGKETIPLTLHFEKAGKVEITVPVQKVESSSAMAGGG